jgi:hypothetical protein
MSVSHTSVRSTTEPRTAARKGAHVGALWGLAARGVLYLLLAVLALDLAVGGTRGDVDTPGALHRLAHDPLGNIVLVLLAVGFAAFALWHAYVALWGSSRDDTSRRLSDAGRAIVYALLCALAISFLVTSKRSGNTDQTDKTWTARVLDWSGGALLVGAVGVAIIACGAYLIWRALSGGPQDEPAVLDAAPRETGSVHVLGAIGNCARGIVVGLVGVFLVGAAVDHDPNKTVGLDGALKRLLDHSFGDVAVVLVALGLAAFGLYSLARAWVNRGQPSGTG